MVNTLQNNCDNDNFTSAVLCKKDEKKVIEWETSFQKVQQ